MIDKRFEELRGAAGLPSPSFIGLRVIRLTRSEGIGIDELARTIMADPALSGRVLKLANSGLDEGEVLVDSVRRAALRLGIETLRSVALGFSLVADNRRGPCVGFDYDRYWAESLAAAVAARELATVRGPRDGADAFTCALLADVGRLALASVHPERYAELARRPELEGRELAAEESGVFDISHPEVTALMLSDWGLPESFQQVALDLYEEDLGCDDPVGRLRRIVVAARAMAPIFVAPGEMDPLSESERLERAARALELPRQDLEPVCDRIRLEWLEWSEAVGLETARGTFSSIPDVLPPAPPGGGEAVTRILLVDDDVRMLRLMRHHLAREGFDVATAESSEQGLERALALAPQILVTDWMMPGMSGLKLCEALRKSAVGRRMYILIVTARDDDDQVVEAFAAGADDYVVKPFDTRILLARVRAGQRMIRMRERVEESERERLRQVAELGILTRRLRSAALTDALTELPNRRYAMARLKQEWEMAERTRRPLSAIMIDIDHFKRVNDEGGHDVGDAVLRDVARALRSNSRTGDVLCRLGGEEFLSINVSCDLERALVCGERLRQAVEDAVSYSAGGGAASVTVSLGVAERRDGMQGIDDLLRRADAALYAAKRAGRNRVASFADGSDVAQSTK